MHQILWTWKDNPKYSRNGTLKVLNFKLRPVYLREESQSTQWGGRYAGPTDGMHMAEAGGEEGDLFVMGIESSSSIQ